MAKFCTKCGKPLQEGEVCSCSIEQTENQQAGTTGGIQTETTEGSGIPTPEITNQPQENSSQVNMNQAQQNYYQGNPNQTQGNPYQSNPNQTQEGQSQWNAQQAQGNLYQGNPGQAQGNPYQGPQGNPGQQGPQGAYNPYQGPGYQQQQAQPGAAGQFFGELWHTIINCYKKPADTLPGLVSNGKIQIACALLGIHALLFSIYVTIMFAMMNGSMSLVSQILSSAGLSSGSISFPVGRIFFLTLLISVLIHVAFAGLYMLFQSLIIKVKCDFKHAISVASARAVALIPFVLAALLVGLINVSIGVAVYMLGGVAAILYMVTAISGSISFRDNKCIFMLILTFIGTTLVTMILILVFYQYYLPDTVRAALSYLKMAGSSLY